MVAGREGTIAFPRSRARMEDALRWARRLGGLSWWSLRPDTELGVRLLARGFEWGWEPHWMALDLARLPGEESPHEVDAERGGHFVVRAGGEPVGHVAVNAWRGVAGIYDMWVDERFRRRGIGRALTIAACRRACDLGCSHATLNATALGERVYRAAGFESLGMGQTWWWHGWPPPTARQTALVEAIGFGDLDALPELRPTRAELERAIRGPGPPLAVAVIARQTEAADWILRRRPDLASRPLDRRGATLLHYAVESEDEAMVEVALAHSADPSIRDHVFDSTPVGWAEHFGHQRLVARLAPLSP